MCYKWKSADIVSSNQWLPSKPSIARFPDLSKDTGNLDFYGEYSNIVTIFLTGCELTFGEPNKTRLWMSDQQRPLTKISWLQNQLMKVTQALIYSTHIHSYCIQSIHCRRWRKPQLAGKWSGAFATRVFEIRHAYF